MPDMSEPFCYAYGSFVRTAPFLRRADSDIDLICHNATESEIRQALHDKYDAQKHPHLKTATLEIQAPTYDDNGKLVISKSYFQPCRITHLFGERKSHTCISMMQFSDHFRNPDKRALVRELSKDRIDWIRLNGSTKYSQNHAIDRHYGLDEFDHAVRTTSRQDGDKATQRVFSRLRHSDWTVNDSCRSLGHFIRIVKSEQKVESHETGQTMPYGEFLSKCFK